MFCYGRWARVAGWLLGLALLFSTAGRADDDPFADLPPATAPPPSPSGPTAAPPADPGATTDDPFEDRPGGRPGELGPEPPLPEAPARLIGRWLHLTGDGSTDYLELFEGRRFIYRNTRGLASAGWYQREGVTLSLEGPEVRRVFVFELAQDRLRLTPAGTDAPREGAALAAMPPHGPQTVTWRRSRLTTGAQGGAPLRGIFDLAGEWRHSAGAGREDWLRIAPDGEVVFSGDRGLAATAAADLQDGQLTLTSPPLCRSFAVGLDVSTDGWRLSLGRLGVEDPPAVNGLADLPPALGLQAVYTRPLDPIESGDLAGRYQWVGDGPVHRLVMLPGGQLRYSTGESEALPGHWALQGGRLTLAVIDAGGRIASRVFLVQPRLHGLLFVGDPAAEQLPGPPLDVLPPQGAGYALYQSH